MFDFRVSKAVSSRCFSLEPGFSPRYSLENSGDPLTSAAGRDKPVGEGQYSAIMDGGSLKVNSGCRRRTLSSSCTPFVAVGSADSSRPTSRKSEFE